MGSELTALIMVGFLAFAGLSIGSASGFPVAKNASINASASVTAELRNKAMEPVSFEGIVEKLMPYFNKMPGLNSSDDGTLQIQVSLVNSSRAGAASNFIPLYTIDFRTDPYNHTMMLNPSSVNFNVSSFLQEFPLYPMEIKYAVINVTLCSAEGKEILRKVMGKKRYVVQKQEAEGSQSEDPFIVFVKKPKKLRDDDYFLRFVLTLAFYGFYICLFGFVVRQNWRAGV